MPRVNKSGNSRGWRITWNNVSDEHLREAKDNLEHSTNVRYACGQLEVGGNCGTRHWEAYVEFTGPRSLQYVRKLFPGAHAEQRRGTPTECRVYCSKDETSVGGTFWEHGTIPQEKGAGKRNDLVAVRERFRNGAKVSDIYEEYPGVAARYPKYVQKCADMYLAPRSWKTEIRVYKGPTRCGKTKAAYDEFPDIWAKPEGQWFDGYDGQPHVLIDDFDGGRDCGIRFRFLLRLLDRYPLEVPIKGGFVKWLPRIVIITTNVEPDGWYPWEDYAPLRERFDEIRRWDRPGGVVGAAGSQ